MAEGGGLEPPSPKAPVFKTGALPITLTLRNEYRAKLYLTARHVRELGSPVSLFFAGFAAFLEILDI